MKKYLFIVLLVGVCFAQLSVKSKHHLEPFKIKGGLSTYKYSFVNIFGDSIDKKSESKIEYIVKSKSHAMPENFCLIFKNIFGQFILFKI